MKTTIQVFVLVALMHVLVGCAAKAQMSAPTMDAMQIQPAASMPAPPKQLTDNHFRSDQTGNLSEKDIKAILDAPVFLEDMTRVGIVPVATAYEVDRGIPLSVVPQQLSEALETTGLFDVTTEVSTDWPKVGSVAGLRELAARYRVKYLLLYRHRFVEDEFTNGWGWSWMTVVGGLMTPHTTLRSAGVMEASLFDVRTGTILFTVFERVYGDEDVTVWNDERGHEDMKQTLLSEGLQSLADQMKHKVSRLDVARKRWEDEQKMLEQEKKKEATAMKEGAAGKVAW